MICNNVKQNKTELLAMMQKIQSLETELQQCKGERYKALAENQHAQNLLSERQIEIIALQQKAIESNNFILKSQHQLADNNIETTRKFEHLNQQLYDFMNENTIQWSEVSYRKCPNYLKRNDTNETTFHTDNKFTAP